MIFKHYSFLRIVLVILINNIDLQIMSVLCLWVLHESPA